MSKKKKAEEIETFNFGYYGDEDVVPCPELTAFLDELIDVCEKHGMGFELDGGHDEPAKVVIVPFDKADFDWATNHLDEYQGGVPALDRAKEAQAAKREERRIRDLQASARANVARRERERLAAEAEIEAAVRLGIFLGGKHYRLVEEDLPIPPSATDEAKG